MFKRLCIAALVLCVGYAANLAQRCKNGDSEACGQMILQVLQACKSGDSEACKVLILYYQESCNTNEATGCYNLGVSCMNGRGVQQDYKEAAQYFQKTCGLGLDGAIGCYWLGLLYEAGKGVQQNEATAQEYFGKACDYGLQKGCDSYKKLKKKGL